MTFVCTYFKNTFWKDLGQKYLPLFSFRVSRYYADCLRCRLSQMLVYSASCHLCRTRLEGGKEGNSLVNGGRKMMRNRLEKPSAERVAMLTVCQGDWKSSCLVATGWGWAAIKIYSWITYALCTFSGRVVKVQQCVHSFLLVGRDSGSWSSALTMQYVFLTGRQP